VGFAIAVRSAIPAILVGRSHSSLPFEEKTLKMNGNGLEPVVFLFGFENLLEKGGIEPEALDESIRGEFDQVGRKLENFAEQFGVADKGSASIDDSHQQPVFEGAFRLEIDGRGFEKIADTGLEKLLIPVELEDLELFLASSQDIELATLEPSHHLDNTGGATDSGRFGIAAENQSEGRILLDAIPDHAPVAHLEDVQWQRHPREQYQGKRKQGEEFLFRIRGHLTKIVLASEKSQHGS
jgi:hypothetical protein